MRILFDTNIVLDVLLDRTPFVRSANYLFDRVDRGDIGGLLTPTTLTTSFYFVEKEKGADVGWSAIHQLVQRFEIATVGRPIVESTLHLGFTDFEDAILHEAGRAASVDGIVTRNEQDFTKASLSIYRPEELVRLLRQSNDN